MTIQLYTDGSFFYQKNKIGGWAYLFDYHGEIIRDSGGVLNTTNNQMEMLAVIRGLERLKKINTPDRHIVIVSDSKYVIRGASQWIQRWQTNGWLSKDNKIIKNRELWINLDKLAQEFQTRWLWVRGHAGHPYNEAVDNAARRAALLLTR